MPMAQNRANMNQQAQAIIAAETAAIERWHLEIALYREMVQARRDAEGYQVQKAVPRLTLTEFEEELLLAEELAEMGKFVRGVEMMQVAGLEEMLGIERGKGARL
ncbi:hypothetical protein LTR85_010428 [Meristemomyces frigidus]|nr:hypothetical protein LTR85_010428 [Meristemomyces frigidus]